MTEAALHKSVADYLSVALPAGVPWTTFPAGGGGRVRGSQLKRAGLQKGWPDIQILVGGLYCGIELKAPGKYPEPHQRAIHEAIKQCGGRVAVCRSVDEVEGTLKAWGVPIRTRVAA